MRPIGLSVFEHDSHHVKYLEAMRIMADSTGRNKSNVHDHQRQYKEISLRISVQRWNNYWDNGLGIINAFWIGQTCILWDENSCLGTRIFLLGYCNKFELGQTGFIARKLFIPSYRPIWRVEMLCYVSFSSAQLQNQDAHEDKFSEKGRYFFDDIRLSGSISLITRG